MKKEFRGFSKVFSLTLKQQLRKKGFQATFLIVALLLLLAPVVIMSLMEAKGDKTNGAGNSGGNAAGATAAAESTNVKQVTVVDTDREHVIDYGILNQHSDSAFAGITYSESDSLEAALFIGTVCVRAINPQTDMILVQFFGTLNLFSGMFRIGGILFALAIFLAGFLLYCSMAAVGGSMASKQEDLGTTNLLFTMVLLISFMATLFGGVLEGNVASWMIYVPFTAVLAAPGEALLGNLTITQGCISLAILVMTAVAFMWLAGKIYKMLVLYKGNPPSIVKVLSMMKEK